MTLFISPHSLSLIILVVKLCGRRANVYVAQEELATMSIRDLLLDYGGISESIM
jgi:hypothetical protein